MTDNPYHPRTSGCQRDLVGYGAAPPNPHWPGGPDRAADRAELRGGSENAILHGDAASEAI
jgi:hypothetical protein